ncbi:DUF1348-domain-containing protein [Eremomyces bilateralis CBS 781.70]|uniref:DUF1348-domain-containing protein n=1 Tax=Eremomyces bilateralis CBS 781.70 TaxID=1392243 RepID=A0A6G1FTZ5_9PEZI|nr:DUF1348-domain-containing protein [Eremomyces bilateralis CBS 781.70]KAF1809162.1 DUF1348-domain-containing protein [Eremomyces bilateralis CBS 781.70]
MEYQARLFYPGIKVPLTTYPYRDPESVAKAYTPDCIWRNRGVFITGHDQIVAFLTAKWEREQNYRLRKELFCFHDKKIAVQFWYEYQDAQDGMKWKRCYGLEDWTFGEDGRMIKRMMSGNDIVLTAEERWFKEGVDEDRVKIGDAHW